MTKPSYHIPDETYIARDGAVWSIAYIDLHRASMLAHIANHQTPQTYHRRSRRDTDEGGGLLFRDKAQRLARWHRKNQAR